VQPEILAVQKHDNANVVEHFSQLMVAENSIQLNQENSSILEIVTKTKVQETKTLKVEVLESTESEAECE